MLLCEITRACAAIRVFVRDCRLSKTLAAWLWLPAGLPQSLWYAARANRPSNAKAATISLRDRLDGDLAAMPISAATDRLQKEILERRVRKTFCGSANLEAKAAANKY
jgi:hypothetical protein